MHKSIFIILGFLFLTSCSQNKPTPVLKKEPLKEKIPEKKIPKKKIPHNTNIIDEEIREFIPEHIRKSKIEVVKHY